jgi:hypothetical protein
MIKSLVFFFVFLLGLNSSNAQYLYLDDFITLLELAEDSERTEVEKFLQSKGFSFDNFEYIIDDGDDENDTTHFMITYYKKWFDGECYVRVDADSDEDNYIVIEFSYEEDRTLYIASVLADAGLQPEDYWENDDGTEGFRFETDNYGIIISEVLDDDEEIFYRFSIYSY